MRRYEVTMVLGEWRKTYVVYANNHRRARLDAGGAAMRDCGITLSPNSPRVALPKSVSCVHSPCLPVPGVRRKIVPGVQE